MFGLNERYRWYVPGVGTVPLTPRELERFRRSGRPMRILVRVGHTPGLMQIPPDFRMGFAPRENMVRVPTPWWNHRSGFDRPRPESPRVPGPLLVPGAPLPLLFVGSGSNPRPNRSQSCPPRLS